MPRSVGSVPKCPRCSSLNIQKRDLIISGGTSTTFGVGASPAGGVAVGVGRSRTQLSKDARFMSQSDTADGCAINIVASVIGIVLGAIGWIIEVIFDGIFGTEILAYFIFIPAGLGAVGFRTLMWFAQEQEQERAASIDRERQWMCLACGAKFSEPDYE